MRTSLCLGLAVLSSCIGAEVVEETSETHRGHGHSETPGSLDRIVWTSPTKPIANLDVAGVYYDPLGEESLQGLRSLQLKPCGFDAGWRGTSDRSTGPYEALSAWDHSAQRWTTRTGELHLWIADEDNVFSYALGDDGELTLLPTSSNAIEQHGAAGWRLKRSSGIYRTRCAWPGEDLSCLGLTPPAARGPECPIVAGWPQESAPPFAIASTSRQVDRAAYEWELRVSADPVVQTAIRCVEYVLHPTFPNPVRTVCEGAPSRFAIRDYAWGEFDVVVTAVLDDGSLWSVHHALRLRATE